MAISHTIIIIIIVPSCNIVATHCRRSYIIVPDQNLILFTVPNSNNCFEGEVRLTNSSYLNEGRVEMCTNGVWGMVCPNNWSNLESSVVCKQLGYSEYGNSAGKTTTITCDHDNIFVGATTTTVANGQLPSYFGDVRCTGNELRLTDCPHRKGTFTCSGCSSVGIRCNYDTACK